MGRRRQRQRERRSEQRRADFGQFRTPVFRAPVDDGLAALFAERAAALAPQARTCGECVEFVEDELASRGSCLHPGSGIVSPWTDTEACAFFTGRRRDLRTARY